MTEQDVKTISFRRRHLPHWTVADRSYFVTMRLKASLPTAIAAALREERAEFLRETHTGEELNTFERQRFRRIDQILDAAKDGPMFLAEPHIADLVVDAFAWVESVKGWEVHALTVMPNHVHSLIRNARGENHKLNEHLGRLKGFVAREANKKLGRTGQAFWMGENFDHWCRSDVHLRKAVRYIAMNPVKAGLAGDWTDWQWSRVSAALLPDDLGGGSGKNARPTVSGIGIEPE